MKYKYFEDVFKNARFINTRCDLCGSDKNCLNAIYFDLNCNIESVCLSCLDNKKIGVNIPDYIKKRIVNDKNKKTDELKYTPPVPWVQNNDWPVCHDDFMVYIGEFTKDDIIHLAQNQNEIEIFKRMIAPNLQERIIDYDVLLNNLGNTTIAFAFRCSICKTIRIILQDY